MERHLYLVRHGQTMFNTKLIIQGWCDSPLTVKGREQAERAGAFFCHEGISFDHAYASPLGRTRETIERITTMPYVCDSRLKELFFGDCEGERDVIVPTGPWGDFFMRYGGESVQQLTERMNEALTDIMGRTGHERVLVVSHGTACQVFLERWRAMSAIAMEGIPGNCSVMHLIFDGKAFSLREVVEQGEMRRLLDRIPFTAK